MNDNEFKYLTISGEDNRWGLFLNVPGLAKVQSNVKYPSAVGILEN